MPSLNLGDLQVGVKVAGVDKVKQDLNSVKDAVKDVDSQSNNASGGISSLVSAFKDGISNSSAFGVKLGDLKGGLSDGTAMTTLMQGAVAGLSMSLVNMAVQAAQQAISALVQFGKASLKAASDLEETKNVLDVVFGEQGTREIESWANGMIMAFGMSSTAASDFASKFGLLFNDLGGDTIEMSKAFTELAGDLASLYNTEVDQAFTALRSAIVGESEPLRNFGVFLSDATLNQFALEQSIGKTTSQMSEQEKMMLRYNYILQNTTEAQGDAIRSEGSYAKTLKQTAALWEEFLTKMGQLLLPIVNGILTVANAILGVFLTTGEETTRALENESKKAVSISENTNKSIQESSKKHLSTMETMQKEHNATMEELSKTSQTYLERQMSEYEKQLREQYNGGTLAEERKIQKKLELHEKMLRIKLEREELYYKQVAQFEEKYLVVSKTNGNSTSISYVPRYANGTSSAAGGLSIVGEVGRELMWIPPKAQIINNNTTEQILSNKSGHTFTGPINVQANNVNEFLTELKMAIIGGELQW